MARFSTPVFVLLLALTMAYIIESSSHSPYDIQLGLAIRNGDGGLLVGDMIDPNEEMMMESESARRNLGGKRYISYDALNKNKVPCNARGRSYYNCGTSGRANPYRRGCTAATRCARRN